MSSAFHVEVDLHLLYLFQKEKNIINSKFNVHYVHYDLIIGYSIQW